MWGPRSRSLFLRQSGFALACKVVISRDIHLAVSPKVFEDSVNCEALCGVSAQHSQGSDF
jgi:hypothetical protein